LFFAEKQLIENLSDCVTNRAYADRYAEKTTL